MPASGELHMYPLMLVRHEGEAALSGQRTSSGMLMRPPATGEV